MKTLMLTLLTASWLSLALVSESAGPVLGGHVTAAGSGQPLRGARVFVPGSAHGTTTDASGEYALDLPAGWVGTTVEIRVELVGYAAWTGSVAVAADGTTLDVALRSEPLELSEVVVGAVADERERTVADAMAWAPAAASTLIPGRHAEFNTESYARIEENGFRSVHDAPLSTFSIDVDRASYSNVRRFINEGRRPPVDAVRIEEMVNYFDYAYDGPKGEHPLAITTEATRAPWQPEHLLLRVGLQARKLETASLPPNNLVFLLDVSGSMQSPNKLPLLKTSLRLLVNQLRPDDRVAIVVYAGSAGLVLPSTDGSRKEEILDAIERLEAGGSTAGGAGLRLAYRVATENHREGMNSRVILATDGDFNVGPSSTAEMIRLVEERRDYGVSLSVLGFGSGNLQDDRMEQMADHGNGNYAYIDGVLEARKQLVTEMGGTLLTLAKDVKLQVEFNPALVRAYRLIGYENRLLRDEDFNDDTKDAGELGAGHTVTALYEVVPVDAVTEVTGGSVDALRYQDDRQRTEIPADELLFVKLRYKAPQAATSRLVEHPVPATVPEEASSDLRFAAAVAAFGMILRDSQHCGDFGLDDVADLASGGIGPDPHGYRTEFARLVEATRELGLVDPQIR